MESSYLVEGPFRAAPLPAGSNQYPSPEKRLVANLALVAVPPFASKDDLRPAVPCWYYTLVASDNTGEAYLLQQGVPEHEIAPRVALFSLLGPDAFGLARAAHHLALSLGWQPMGVSPKQPPSSDGGGFRPWAEAMSRPRPPKPLPMEMVLQHAMTIRTKLFAGKEIPGWMFAWDTHGNPHKPCGLVYGQQGLAIGSPCGRKEGCTLRGGACVWSEQVLAEGAGQRGPVSVVPDSAPTEPLPYVPPAPVYSPGIQARHPGVGGPSSAVPWQAPIPQNGGGDGFRWQALQGAGPAGWPAQVTPAFQPPPTGPTAWGGPGTPLPPQPTAQALPAPASGGWPAPPTQPQPPQPQPPVPAQSLSASPAVPPPVSAQPPQPAASAGEWPPPAVPPALDFV